MYLDRVRSTNKYIRIDENKNTQKEERNYDVKLGIIAARNK